MNSTKRKAGEEPFKLFSKLPKLCSPKQPSQTQHTNTEKEFQARKISNSYKDCKEPTSEELSLNDLGLSQELQNLCTQVGIIKPTPIQRACIPTILASHDIIGIAQTGSGKTAAFALPIIQTIGQDPYGVCALVLSPTRELALQTDEQFKVLGSPLTMRIELVVGGTDQTQQSLKLQKRPHIVVATPGRLQEIMSCNADLGPIFKRLKFLILDEADRLLDKTFEDILKNLLRILPLDRQTLLFSATMSQAMIKLQQGVLRNAFTFQAYTGLKTADRLQEEFMLVPSFVRDATLFYILDNLEEQFSSRSCMVFCSAPQACYLLQKMLKNLGIEAVQLHASLPQRIRTSSITMFKQGQVKVLLATDIASRGLDIPTVDLVVNYNVPFLSKDYVHRVGRTARAGRPGRAITFLSNQGERKLIKKIEQLVGHELEEFVIKEEKVEKLVGRVKKAKTKAGVDIISEEVKEVSKYTHKGKREKKDWLSL